MKHVRALLFITFLGLPITLAWWAVATLASPFVLMWKGLSALVVLYDEILLNGETQKRPERKDGLK